MDRKRPRSNLFGVVCDCNHEAGSGHGRRQRPDQGRTDSVKASRRREGIRKIVIVNLWLPYLDKPMYLHAHV